jgi:hypothetical protein
MRLLVRPGGAGAREHGREVAGAEAHQRVVGVEAGDDDLAHLAVGHRVAGAGAHDLDQHAFVDHQAFARAGLVRDEAEVGGGVALRALHAVRGDPVVQARRKGFAGDECLGEGQLLAFLLGLLQQYLQEARRARIACGLQVGNGFELLLGLAGAAREHGAAQGVRAGFHDGAGRRHVIAEAVVDELAAPKAGRMQRARRAPVVARFALGFVDGAGAREHARHARPAHDRCESAEGVVGTALLLQLEQFGFARDRQLLERLARRDVRGLHAVEDLLERGRGCLRLRDLFGQCGEQVALAFGGVTDL